MPQTLTAKNKCKYNVKNVKAKNPFSRERVLSNISFNISIHVIINSFTTNLLLNKLVTASWGFSNKLLLGLVLPSSIDSIKNRKINFDRQIVGEQKKHNREIYKKSWAKKHNIAESFQRFTQNEIIKKICRKIYFYFLSGLYYFLCWFGCCCQMV